MAKNKSPGIVGTALVAAFLLLALAAGGCRKKPKPPLPAPPPPQGQAAPQPEPTPVAPEAQAEKAPGEKGEGKPSEENQPAAAPSPAGPQPPQPHAAAARRAQHQSPKQDTKTASPNRPASLPSANQPAAGQPPANQPAANQPPPQLEAELNPQQARLYRTRAQETISETKRHFALLKEKRLSTEQQATLKQAQAFLSQARQALAANDLIRGMTLAQKAHVLSLELLRSTE